jgi:hypothetical protein
MMRRMTVVAALAALLLGAGALQASAQGRPASLEQCYLDVAATKGSADAVHLAREICDAVFRRGPRSLSVLQGKKECVEWWFDGEGRYESADLYCALEPSSEQQWKLACQWKGGEKPYTFVELRENGGRLDRVGELRGKRIGPLFTSLAACIEERAKPSGGS